MDYAPSVTHWCLGRRCLEPAVAQGVTHLRNLILQHTPSVAVSFLVTKPVVFSREAVKAISQHLKTLPKLACPSALSDLCDPMLVWVSWNVIEADDQTKEPGSYPRVAMVTNSGTHHRHLRPGWALAGGAGAKLPNFPLDSRPECAGKTANLPPDALARYQADRQPPEQHLWANGLTRDGAWRQLRSSEKESVMGFPEGFTLSAWLTSDATRDVQGFELCRLDLLGQSLHVGLLKVFTQQLFHPSGTMHSESNVAEAAGASSEDDVTERLVRAISARQHHRGRLIKQLSPSGPPTHGPLSALRPHWWKWRTVISSRWNYADHINTLELQAHLAILRWRTRTPQCVGVRSLHVLDSQVALNILTKVVNKCNAICLTASYNTLTH